MAAVEITISGVLYDKYNRTQQNVVLFGEASLTGLQVGGGPMPPGGGGQPPNWSPIHPSHPIANPWPPYVDAGPPGAQPPWSPGHPEHPIPPIVGGGPILPPDLPPTMPPPDSRPIDWKTAWTPTTGWVVIGVPSGPHPTPST